MDNTSWSPCGFKTWEEVSHAAASKRFSGLRGTQWCYKSVFSSGSHVIWSATCSVLLLGACKDVRAVYFMTWGLLSFKEINAQDASVTSSSACRKTSLARVLYQELPQSCLVNPWWGNVLPELHRSHHHGWLCAYGIWKGGPENLLKSAML